MKFDGRYLWHVSDPSAPRYIGVISSVVDGKGVSLRYGDVWLQTGFALSEDMPLVDIEHLPRSRPAGGNAVAVGAVDDARPDQWGERVIGLVGEPSRCSIMEFLHHPGDDRFGALSTSTSATMYSPKSSSPIPKISQAQEISDVIRKIANFESVNDSERALISSGSRFGGAKPKALIDIDGDQWVIKFYNGEPIDVPLVEHATMTLARSAHIRTAETMPIPLIGEHAVAVRRFDRSGDKRLHCISAGTALRASTTPEQLSLGYPALALLLRRSGDATQADNDDIKELFRRMVFNILIDNTDDHEKNHTLVDITLSGRYRLSPAYDVLPANSGQGMQEFVCGLNGRDSSLANAMSQCNLFGLSPQEAASQVGHVVEAVNDWKKHFRSCGVSEGDISSLAQSIDDSDIGFQRANFDASAYGQSAASRGPTRSGAFRRT